MMATPLPLQHHARAQGSRVNITSSIQAVLSCRTSPWLCRSYASEQADSTVPGCQTPQTGSFSRRAALLGTTLAMLAGSRLASSPAGIAAEAKLPKGLHCVCMSKCIPIDAFHSAVWHASQLTPSWLPRSAVLCVTPSRQNRLGRQKPRRVKSSSGHSACPSQHL